MAGFGRLVLIYVVGLGLALSCLFVFAAPSRAAPSETSAQISVAVGTRPGQASATFEEALLEARRLRAAFPGRPVTISLSKGVLRLRQPIRLTALDSGTAAAPLRIVGASDGGTTISGAIVVAPGATNSGIVIAPATARLADLAFDTAAGRSLPMLFEGNRALTTVRWPQQGYAANWLVTNRQGVLIASNSAYPGRAAGPVLLAGYLDHDWAYRAFRTSPSAGGFALPKLAAEITRATHVRLRVLNAPLPPKPGQFWFDEARQQVQVRRYGTGAAVELAIAPLLLDVRDVAYLEIVAIAFEKVAGDAVSIRNSRHVTLSDCFVGLSAGNAITILAGADVAVTRCVIASTGAGGVILSGGDRTTLQPSQHRVTDSVIERFGTDLRTYRPGVNLSGVGNVVQNSLLRSAPHAAVLVSGNENSVVDNEISQVLCETGDAGAIYMGRDWTQRGNRIVGNFIHDIAPLGPDAIDAAIYLDDQFSGVLVEKNIMLRVPTGLLIGGGRDNKVTDNIFAEISRSAIHYDSRGLTWQHAMSSEGGQLRVVLTKSPYQTELWKRRYPELAAMLDGKPGSPEGNLAMRNLVIGSPLVRSFPPGIILTGTGNREVAISADVPDTNVGTPQAQLQKLLSYADQRPTRPGPRRPLLFAKRIAASGSCAED